MHVHMVGSPAANHVDQRGSARKYGDVAATDWEATARRRENGTPGELGWSRGRTAKRARRRRSRAGPLGDRAEVMSVRVDGAAFRPHREEAKVRAALEMSGDLRPKETLARPVGKP